MASLRTIERAVAPLRQELQAEARASVRFETPPGQQLQIDFGEMRVPIGGEAVRVHLFVATLGYSRRPFVQAFRHERQSAWFDGLEGAFRHFGGMPQEVLLDNARALVDAPRRGDARGAVQRAAACLCPLLGRSRRAPARRTGPAPRARTSAASAMSSATRSPAMSLPVGRRSKRIWSGGCARSPIGVCTARPARRRCALRARRGGGAEAAGRPAAVPPGARAHAPGAERLRRRGRHQPLSASLAAHRRERRGDGGRRPGAHPPCRPARSRFTRRRPAGGSGSSTRRTSMASPARPRPAGAEPARPAAAPALLRPLAEYEPRRGGGSGADGTSSTDRRLLRSRDPPRLADPAQAHRDPRPARQPARRGGAPRADPARGAGLPVRARDRAQGRAAHRDGDARSPTSRACATSTASTSPPSPRSIRARSASSPPAAGWRTARRCCCSGRPGVGKTHWPSRSAAPPSARATRCCSSPPRRWSPSLAKAHAEGRLEERLGFFAKPKLLIVDELGYLPFETNAAHLFFQLVSRRYERGSLLITSNRSVGEWGAV